MMEKDAVGGIAAIIFCMLFLYFLILPVRILYRQNDEFTARVFWGYVGALPAAGLVSFIFYGVTYAILHAMPNADLSSEYEWRVVAASRHISDVSGTIAGFAAIASLVVSWCVAMGFAIHRKTRV